MSQKTTTTTKSFFLALVLAPLACSASPKTDTATPEPAPAPAPAPAPEPVKPPAKPIPDGFFAITPQIVVKGVDAAVDFYTKSLGAQKVYSMAGPDGKTMHAEIKIGDSLIMVEEENPAEGMKSPILLGGTSASLMVYTPDADAAFAALTAAGAKVDMPLEDQFWGDRWGAVIDPFGHRWAVATHLEELTPEQMAERGKLAMQPPPKGKKAKKGEPAWKKIAGTPATHKEPKEYHKVTIGLTVANAAAVIDFYKAAFGAVEKMRMPAMDGKRIMHAEVQIGDTALMISDAFPEMGGKSPADLGGSALTLHHYVTDVDGVFAKAQAAGGKSLMAVTDMFWGDRYGLVLDPAGYAWGVATHKEDVPPEQIGERMKQQMAQEKPKS